MTDPVPTARLRPRHRRRRAGRRVAGARAGAARAQDRGRRGGRCRPATADTRATTSARRRSPTAPCGPSRGSACGATCSARRRPIRRIHVSEQGRFGVARIDAAEQGLESLGCVLPNRVIGAALWEGLRSAPGVEIIAPASVVSTSSRDGARVLDGRARRAGGSRSARGSWSPRTARARAVREQAGIASEHWDYGQTAIVTTMTAQRFHDHVAYERFTPDGPIAVLPLADGRCGVVWTRGPGGGRAACSRCPTRNSWPSSSRRSGSASGRLHQGRRPATRTSSRLSRSERHVGPRIAIVGAAAQGLHPIAGQGFNIGLRDAACLAEVIADSPRRRSHGRGRRRRCSTPTHRGASEDRRRIVAFTDGLVRLFGTPLGLMRGLRSAGLLAFDVFPPAKAAMSRLSVGAAGRVPRLARGVPLTGPAP